jgi:hypothetical protein
VERFAASRFGARRPQDYGHPNAGLGDDDKLLAEITTAHVPT